MADQQGYEYRGPCEVTLGESHYGACDAIACGGRASYFCQLEDCAVNICERHFERCPGCGLIFCSSPDAQLHDCFHLHQTDGACEHSLIAPLLDGMETHLADPSHDRLRMFARHDADGCGNPLPVEVCSSFALASLCLDGKIEDIPRSAKIEQKETQRRMRTERQREARACARLGLEVIATRNSYHRVDLYKRSTILIAGAAMLTRAFTGRPHYAEQHQLLGLLKVNRQQDFVRDRLDALQSMRPGIYSMLSQRAEQAVLRQRHSHLQQRSMF